MSEKTVGGDRPMTLRRGVTLTALVAIVIGTLTGLSHVGASTISSCAGTWRAVVGTSTDATSSPTQATRAGSLVPSPCASSGRNPSGAGYEAYFTFHDEADAQAYVAKLMAAGYAKTWGFTPYVQAPQPATGQ